MARGGYRKPTNPAPVSGPGSLSKRTDGGPADTQAAKYVSGLPWGQGQELMNIQQSADLAATPNIEQASTPNMGFASAAATPPIIPLDAPTMRKGEPVTHGADLGPGGNTSILGLGSQEKAADDQYRAMIASYMPALLKVAANPKTSVTTRAIIRQLRDMI